MSAPEEGPLSSYPYREELKAEYLTLQGFLEDYDKRALSLKAMATPLLGLGIAASINERSVVILIATTGVTLCLWVLEAIWKSFQYRHADRVMLIEESYRDGHPEAAGAPFQIYTSWTEAGKRYRNYRIWVRLFSAPFVSLPYVVILALAYVGAFYIGTDRPVPKDGAAQCQPVAEVTVTPSEPADAVDDGVASCPPVTVPTPEPDGTSVTSTQPPADTSAMWLVVTMGLVVLGTGGWLISLLVRRRKLVAEGAAPAQLAAVATQALGVTAIGALTAFGSAMGGVAKVADGWKLALPWLIAPAVTVLAAQFERTRPFKWWAFGGGLFLSVAIVVAHLIDRKVRYQPGSWWSSFLTNGDALLAKLTFADGTALFVALLAYFVALAAASGTGPPKPKVEAG